MQHVFCVYLTYGGTRLYIVFKDMTEQKLKLFGHLSTVLKIANAGFIKLKPYFTELDVKTSRLHAVFLLQRLWCPPSFWLLSIFIYFFFKAQWIKGKPSADHFVAASCSFFTQEWSNFKKCHKKCPLKSIKLTWKHKKIVSRLKEY